MKEAPRASGKYRLQGWIIDFDYLQRIREAMDSDYRVSLEEIEAVLLAVGDSEKEEVDKPDNSVESEQEEWRRQDRPSYYLSHAERFPRRA
jgi:hypothetical protein